MSNLDVEESMVEQISRAREDTLPESAATAKITTASGLAFIVSPIECKVWREQVMVKCLVAPRYSGFCVAIGVCDRSRPQIREPASVGIAG